MMLVASVMSIVSMPFLFVVGISFVLWAGYWIGYVIWHVMLAILHAVILLPEGIKWLFFGIVHGVPYVTRAPAMWATLGIAGVTIFVVFHIYLFFQSNAWKVTRLWMKAKKEKFCIRVRVTSREGIDHGY